MYCSSAAVRAGRRGSAVRWAVVGEEPMPASRLSAKATRQARLARTAPKISGLGRSSRFQGAVMVGIHPGLTATRHLQGDPSPQPRVYAYRSEEHTSELQSH